MICIGKLSEKEKEFLCREISDRLKELVNSSVDIKTKDVVIDLILDLKNNGTSVLCISHDEYTLERMTDRRVNLKHGKIVEESLINN